VKNTLATPLTMEHTDTVEKISAFSADTKVSVCEMRVTAAPDGLTLEHHVL